MALELALVVYFVTKELSGLLSVNFEVFLLIFFGGYILRSLRKGFSSGLEAGGNSYSSSLSSSDEIIGSSLI